MNIKGKKVTLRALEKSDLSLMLKWSNDPELQYWLGGWHFPSSMATMEKWLERISEDQSNLRFAIENEEEGLIGSANLVEINWKDRNAFTGMMLGDTNNRSKGYGTDTVMAIMRYAFEELGLERLDTTIIEYNKPSLKLYCDKCAWEKEGVKKNWYWRKNRYWGKIILGINHNNYLELIKQNKYWESD